MANIKKRLAAAGAPALLAVAGGLVYYFEGDEQPYVDPVGVLTTCIGHTGNVELREYTEQECTELFLADLRTAERAVERCTPGLPEAAKPALISFTFNVGQGAYCSSTLARKANTGDLVGACKELYRWVYAGGEVMQGLVNRRNAEAAACLRGIL